MLRGTTSALIATLSLAALVMVPLPGCSGGGRGGVAAQAVAPVQSATGPAPVTSSAAAPTTSQAAPAPAAPPPGPTPPRGQWLRGDLHSHSAPYSGDADQQFGDPPGRCFFVAEQGGLDFLALTDHRTLDQVRDPGYRANTLTILDGEEWGGTVHMGMVGLTRQVPEIDGSRGPSTLNAQVQAAYDDCHRQGGVVIANHPCLEGKVHIWLSRDFDAIEVWNSYWNIPKGFISSSQADVDGKLRGEGLAAIGEDATPEIREAVRWQGGSNFQAVKFWEAHLNRGNKVAAVGGGDRHSIVFPGLPATYVYSEDRTPQKILAAIRAGRTYVTSGIEGPVVDFEADADGDGVYEALIGDSVPLNRPVQFRVRVRNAAEGQVRIVKDGNTHLQWAVLTADETFTFTETATQRSWLRVDVYEDVDLAVAQSNGFQVLAMAGTIFGQGGFQALVTIGTPLGFQISLGTRAPTIRLPHEYDKILNFDRTNWGFARGAITSPIWME